MMTLAQAQALLPGARAGRRRRASAIERVHSDTRSLRAGDLFVALRGERFDAPRLPARRRAPPAPWRRWPSAAWPTPGCPACRWPTRWPALQQLAAAWRARFALPLIAVTGSNGKTTVTQMIAAILRAWLGDGALGHRGQPEQPHRRAADAAAPAPGRRTGTAPRWSSWA